MNRPTNKKRYGIIYGRYSPRPTDRDKDVLANQVKDCAEWCSQNNVEPIMSCFDPQTSGDVDIWARPGLNACVEALKPGMVLVVRNLDRFARDVLVALAVEKQVVDVCKATIASVENGGFISDDRHARLLRIIQYAMAEFEKAEKSERTARRVNYKLYTEKLAVSRIPPFGYMKVDGKLVEVPDELAIIRIVLGGRLGETRERKSYQQLADYLNETWHRRRNGEKWKKQSVKDVWRACKRRREHWERLMPECFPDSKTEMTNEPPKGNLEDL